MNLKFVHLLLLPPTLLGVHDGNQSDKGGEGCNPNLLPELILLKKDDEALAGAKMSMATFCKTYDLGDDIRELLDNQGLDPVHSLFELQDANLLEYGFPIGSIAELKWALKKMMHTEHPEVCLIAPAVKSPPIEEGGIQGSGAQDGSNIAGFVVQGGTVIQGGVGGKGGAARGPFIPALLVKLFAQMQGDIGGAGGDGDEFGGPVQDGDAPELGALVLSTTEETRRKIPTTLIENLELNNDLLLMLLRKHGYRTVGGLLECRRTDLSYELGFKCGHLDVLKAALSRFCNDCFFRLVLQVNVKYIYSNGTTGLIDSTQRRQQAPQQTALRRRHIEVHIPPHPPHQHPMIHGQNPPTFKHISPARRLPRPKPNAFNNPIATPAAAAPHTGEHIPGHPLPEAQNPLEEKKYSASASRAEPSPLQTATTTQATNRCAAEQAAGSPMENQEDKEKPIIISELFVGDHSA
ncbi:hypothetical protein R3P38DRAFT_3201745 [Favolaschia claudopus]|uniref:Uncharacterized protein n=1 Tax=Favolaschia claudopus TaxID=2862362 RepID=A0AAW0AVP7_9AGAR